MECVCEGPRNFQMNSEDCEEEEEEEWDGGVSAEMAAR
jgi:hypothetical protein